MARKILEADWFNDKIDNSEAGKKERQALSRQHAEFCERSQLIDWFRELNIEKMKALRRAYNISKSKPK